MAIQTTGTMEGDIKSGLIKGGVYQGQPSPSLGSVPLNTPAPTPTPNPTIPPTPTSTSPFALAQVMTALQSKVQSNNALMSQRNLLLKQLYDQPLTDQEKQQLDPTMLQAINSGDRNQIDMKLRLISDEVAGRKNTLDQSLRYLTSAYTDTIKQAESKKSEAINNFLSHAQTLQDQGYDPIKAFETLYPNSGIDWGNLLSQGQSSTGGVDRTTRNNNPTAFTTDVAKQAGLVLGKDYSQGDSFTGPNGQTLYTAKLLGDPVQQTIKAIDKIGFYTKDGTPRWSYIDQIPEAKNWATLTQQQKTDVVNKMNQFETKGTSGASNVNPDEQSFVDKLPAQGQQVYLKQSPNTRSALRQLINGDLLLSDIPGFSGAGAKLKLLELAGQVEPGFSSNVNKRRYQFQQAWFNPNGASFKTRTSINTAMGHIAQLKQDADAIDNSTIQKYNTIANMLKKETGNDAVTNFNYTLTQVASEIASAYKNGTAPTDQEVEQERAALAYNFSPKQFKGVFDRAAKLISSKITSMSQEYKGAMGKYPVDPIIQDTQLQELHDAGIDVSPITSVLSNQGYDVSQYGDTGGSSDTMKVGNDTYIKGSDGLYYKQ